MFRTRFLLAAAAAAIASAPVLAGGLWTDIYHGLDLAVTPTGSPVSTLGNGFRVNGSRLGRVRVMPNRLGDGYRLELDRTFGPDDSGRPEVYNAGPYQLELDGAMQSTLGFTRRNFFTNDHTHNPFFIGNGELFINNMNYEIRETSGIQDVALRGTLNGSGTIQINQLGFYTVTLDVSNTNSEIEFDGVIADGDSDFDYNLGPISVKGNVFYDVALSALTAIGVDTSKLEQIFPESPIDRITQNITDSLADQAGIIGSDSTAKLATASPSSGPTAALIEQVLASATTATLGQDDYGATNVPEPSSLLLIAIGGVFSTRFARR